MKKIDLKTLEKKIILRQLRMEDYDELIELQELCFPGMQTWNREQIESQLKIFPQGQICIELGGKIVASSSSLILDFDLYEDSDDWKKLSDSGYITNHNPDCETLYGIEIMVHPKYRGYKLARRLYQARKDLAIQLNLKNIIIGGRIPGYSEYQEELSAREYVQKVMDKDLYDPVLTTQIANGFVLKRIIPAYMRSDEKSAGYATLLEWSNIDYVPPKRKKSCHLKKNKNLCCSVSVEGN